ncbi:MAG: hypothetical protein JSR45_04810 [Proteobacteria bacterium]|nr:hypothetical protein [Pseudomonadota bacterium]
MARYYFHLLDGPGRLLDPEGKWVEDPAQIPAIALKEARFLIAQDVLRGEVDMDQRLEVEDESHAVVHVVAFKDAVRLIGGRG